MSEQVSPYREAPNDVRYLCTVCYESSSTGPATCPKDGVPLLPLDTPEVVTMVREEVAKRIARKRSWLAGVGVVVSLAVAAAITLGLGLELFDPKPTGPHSNSWLMALFLPIYFVWMWATWRFFAAAPDNESVSALLARLKLKRI